MPSSGHQFKTLCSSLYGPYNMENGFHGETFTVRTGGGWNYYCNLQLIYRSGTRMIKSVQSAFKVGESLDESCKCQSLELTKDKTRKYQKNRWYNHHGSLSEL